MYIYYMDMKTTRTRLEAKRSRVLKKIINLGPFIQGSLVSTTRICGKKGCACRHGGPKHPATYLTWKQDQKTVSLYVPRALESEIMLWTLNYKKLKAILQELSDIQREVLKLRED